jgi:sugar/nucleoside kinase (ribokinase family)
MEFPVTTPHPPYDVVAIGNAIVDVLSHAEDSLLESRGLPKGSMTLIDAATAHDLYTVIGPAIEASGGSAGNTAAGPSSATISALSAFPMKCRRCPPAKPSPLPAASC